MNEHLIEKIKACPTLPSLPSIAVQVLELTQQEEVDISEIAKLISKDPALSGKILKTVNSSFYGRAQAISTISHALVVLGLQSVKTLVLGFSLVSNLSKSKSKGFKHIDYWKHSIYSATAARTIAYKIGLVQQEEAFLIGLLSDIGMMVYDQVLGADYGDVIASATSHAGVAQLEIAAHGMSHSDVSGFIAESWKLPPLLLTPIRAHHNPTSVDDPHLRKLTEVVALASRCADIFVDDEPAQAIAEVRALAKSQFGIEETAFDVVLNDIGTKTKEIAPLFEISLGASDSYANILKSANEALVNITLQSQAQMQNLTVQNEQLKVQATTDRLTGLANRASFDQISQKLWDDSQANGQPFTLLMLDLDKFKSINDTHGHPAGDEVLRCVGKILKGAARAQDTAARYGGEEMILLLPDTPRDMGGMIAETLRKAIMAKPVISDGKSIPVTASIGVASWEPGSPLKTLAYILKAADLSLYNSKKTGRNKVTVFTPKPTAAAA